MGNSQQTQKQQQTTTNNRQQQQQQQSQSQQNKFHQILQNDIIEYFKQSSQDNKINIDSIPNILKINYDKLGQALKVFIKKLYNTQQLNEEQWLSLAEILIKSPNHSNQSIPKFKQLELFSYIFGLELTQTISNQDCLEFLEALFSTINENGSQSAKYFMNRIYDDSLDNQQRINYVLNKISQNIPILSDYLIQFWTKAFSNKNYNTIKQTKLLDKSQIFTEPLLLLLSLQYNLQKDIKLLYSNQKSGTSFNRLAYNLIGYGGPTLILIHTCQKQFHTGEQWPIIFGAYNPQPWNDGLKYQSDQGCYLYSLSPSYKIFPANNGGDFYAYLNTKNIDKSKYKVGLGFGGNQDHNHWRLWIDDELESCSKVHAEDSTYAPGFIAGELDGKIDIIYLEVWGLGGQEALIKQDNYRKERMEELERMRKVDKKQFFSAFDQAMFFEKTFAHKAQVREDVME